MRKRLHVLQVRDGQTWHPNHGQILCRGLQTSIRPACRGSLVRGLSCGCSSTSVRLHLCGCRSPRPRRPPRTSSHWLHQTPPCRQTWHRQGAQGGRRVDVTSAGTPAAHAWMPAEEEFREADTCEVNTSGSQCLETRLAWFRNSPDLLPCAVKHENCSSFLAQALALDHARNHLRSELVWTKAKLALVSHMAGQLRAKLHAAEAQRAHAGGWPARRVGPKALPCLSLPGLCTAAGQRGRQPVLFVHSWCPRKQRWRACAWRLTTWSGASWSSAPLQQPLRPRLCK